MYFYDHSSVNLKSVFDKLKLWIHFSLIVEKKKNMRGKFPIIYTCYVNFIGMFILWLAWFFFNSLPFVKKKVFFVTYIVTGVHFFQEKQQPDKVLKNPFVNLQNRIMASSRPKENGFHHQVWTLDISLETILYVKEI